MTQLASHAKLHLRQNSPLASAVLSKGGAGWSAMETALGALLQEVAQEACVHRDLKQTAYQARALTGINGPVRG